MWIDSLSKNQIAVAQVKVLLACGRGQYANEVKWSAVFDWCARFQLVLVLTWLNFAKIFVIFTELAMCRKSSNFRSDFGNKCLLKSW